MNSISFITAPIACIAKGVAYPFKMVLVIGICALKNAMTVPGVR